MKPPPFPENRIYNSRRRLPYMRRVFLPFCFCRRTPYISRLIADKNEFTPADFHRPGVPPRRRPKHFFLGISDERRSGDAPHSRLVGRNRLFLDGTIPLHTPLLKARERLLRASHKIYRRLGFECGQEFFRPRLARHFV